MPAVSDLFNSLASIDVISQHEICSFLILISSSQVQEECCSSVIVVKTSLAVIVRKD